MNNIRVITFKLLRTYVTKSRHAVAGVRGKMNITKTENHKGFEDNVEEFDQDDVGVYDTDLGDIMDSYADHNRKTEKDRELLKRRIVRSKYFKEMEPNFLTYVEKNHIKKLHREDPEEWTPERLSESFPALPHTIRKILKAEWEPKSVERILAYDNKVVKNWKQFKTGQLPVNPILEEHLMKFKDRKIILFNRETLAEKYMLPKIELPKPKSSFFRSIIADSVGKKSVENKISISLQDNASTGEKKSEATGKKNMRLINKTSNDTTNRDKHSERYEIQSTKDKLITLQNDKSRTTRKSNTSEKKEKLVFESDNDFVNREVHETERYSMEGDTLVFEEFLKKKLNNPDEIPYEERVTLVNTYKKYIETKNLENLRNVSHNTVKDIDNEQKSISSTKNPCDGSIANVTADESESVITSPENENVSLDTHVKERNSYMDEDFNYTKHIKIPKNVYQKGMTYRVRDCYYDCDGEFLYRVPGLKT
ncbi:hypothetical protein QLX08_008909 [Tetragonisca angustula]|uniref:Neurite outgrowth-associated protein n=1 Tax=Tetragonisca angustula TaxID=166442 RepID=A0AAW0ZIV3_9HYME